MSVTDIPGRRTRPQTRNASPVKRTHTNEGEGVEDEEGGLMSVTEDVIVDVSSLMESSCEPYTCRSTAAAMREVVCPARRCGEETRRTCAWRGRCLVLLLLLLLLLSKEG